MIRDTEIGDGRDGPSRLHHGKSRNWRGQRSSVPIRICVPESEIAEGAHVGNFVETKKIKLGKGSKANHLTYLGDAEIGAGVNIGAGTITCNYDGVHKHKTVIDDGCFYRQRQHAGCAGASREESLYGGGVVHHGGRPGGFAGNRTRAAGRERRLGAPEEGRADSEVNVPGEMKLAPGLVRSTETKKALRFVLSAFVSYAFSGSVRHCREQV